MGGSSDSYRHDPDKQRRNTGKGDKVERAEKLNIRPAKALAPFVPALADECIQKLLAGIGLQDNCGSRRNFQTAYFLSMKPALT